MSTSRQPLRPFADREWLKFVRLLVHARKALRSPSSGPLWSAAPPDESPSWDLIWRNWARNQKATPRWASRKSVGEIKQVIRNAQHVRVLGGGYSFSPLVPTANHMLDIRSMNACSIDKQNKTVTAGPGTTIAKLHHELMNENLCLETAPIIPWVTVGGALGTGVHGTGRDFGTLADLVVEAQVVDARGQIRVVNGPKSTNLNEEGRALGCNLGALGVVTDVTFQAVDLFNLEAKDDTRNYWLETTMLSRDGLRSLLQEADYVSALWWPGTERCWVKKWNRTTSEPTTPKAQYFLEQLGIWLGAGVVTKIGEVLADHPEWTPIFTAMVFDEIRHQEYVSPAPDVFHFITRYPMVWNMSFAFDVAGYSDPGIDRVVKAWTAVVDKLEEYRRKGLFPLNMAAHMRHIKSSSSLLSPSTGHNGSVALEIVTLQGEQNGVWSRFFAAVEGVWLHDLCGRPHWGKLHSWGGAGGEPHNPSKLEQIIKSYPPGNLTTFREVRQQWDPNHLFQNPYTEALGL